MKQMWAGKWWKGSNQGPQNSKQVLLCRAQLFSARNSFYCPWEISLTQYSTPNEENILLTGEERCSLMLCGSCQGDAIVLPCTRVVWKASCFKSCHGLCAGSISQVLWAGGFFSAVICWPRDDDVGEGACSFFHSYQ